MQGMSLHPITGSGIPWLASWWGHCAFKAAWFSGVLLEISSNKFSLLLSAYKFKEFYRIYRIFDKSTSWLQVFGAKYIIAIHLRFVEVIYNAWEQLENQSRTITNMKGKSGQDWNPRCNTEARKGPQRTEDGVIAARRENRTVMLTVYCLTVHPMSSVRHCGEEGRIRALWSTLVPPTFSTSLCLRNLTSKEVQRSAVLTHYRQLFIPQPDESRQAGRSCTIIQPQQEVRLLKGATPASWEMDWESGPVNPRTSRCPGINNQKYQCAEIFKNHCDEPL